ncbi:MAG: hypothetical protein HZA54_02820 [Planctomycetes bacterium]|nr:hypothetical protein [Planctomycetota bacterium]
MTEPVWAGRPVLQGTLFVFAAARPAGAAGAGPAEAAPKLQIDGVAWSGDRPLTVARALHRILVADEFLRPSARDPLAPAALVADRRVYRRDEPLRFVALAAGRSGLELAVRAGDRELFREPVALDACGAAVHATEGLGLGSYSAHLISDGQVTIAECEFSVADLTLSPFRARHAAYEVAGDEGRFRYELFRLDAPYAGPVAIGLFCGVCNEVVHRAQETAREGLVSFRFPFAGHGGPFRLEFTTPDGDTATHSLANTASAERREVPLSRLGRVWVGSLLPHPAGRDVRGICVRQEGSETQPFDLEEVAATRVRLRALAPAESVCIVLLPFGAEPSQEITRDRMAKGETLDLSIPAPGAALHVGAWTKRGPFEARAACLRPAELSVAVEAPARAAPGAEVEIVVRAAGAGAGGAVSGVLVVADARLDREEPGPTLARTLFERIEGEAALAAVGDEVDAWGQSGGFAEGALPDAMPMPSFAMPLAPPPPMAAAPMMMTSLAMGMAAPDGIMREVMSSAGETAAGGAGPSDEAPAAAALGASLRTEFPELLLCERIDLQGEVRRRIRLGEQAGAWRVAVYALGGADFAAAEAQIETATDVSVELDLPALAHPGDEVHARVLHRLPGAGTLSVNGPGVLLRDAPVTGSGALEIVVREPGDFTAELAPAGGGPGSALRRTVGRPGVERRMVSTVRLLRLGETLEGERLTVYPGPASFLSEVVKSLLIYPYGCAEQTSAKLAGLAFLRRAWKGGLVALDAAKLERFTVGGLHDMEKFRHEGLFSLWAGGTPEVRTTIKVLRNLSAFHRGEEERADGLVTPACARLRAEGVKDNDLLPLGTEFRAELRGVEDAAAAYFVTREEGERRRLAAYVKERAVGGGTTAHWPATSAWAGVLEATCEALRVMHAAGESALLEAGMNFVSGQFVAGRLKSTSDTRAYVELLAALGGGAGAARAEIDGQETTLTEPRRARRVVARSPGIIVRADREAEFDYLAAEPAFRFRVTATPAQVERGRRVEIRVIPGEAGIAPVCRLYLPGTLALLRGGANAQTVDEPLTGGEVRVEAVAVRRGRGDVRAVLYDMYDVDRIGSAVGVPTHVV